MMKDFLGSLGIIVVAIAFMLLIMIGNNYYTAANWNDGICPKCEVRYELRGASQLRKYYACPNCGKEVERF